jgi:hypothetical protein
MLGTQCQEKREKRYGSVYSWGKKMGGKEEEKKEEGEYKRRKGGRRKEEEGGFRPKNKQSIRKRAVRT